MMPAPLLALALAAAADAAVAPVPLAPVPQAPLPGTPVPAAPPPAAPAPVSPAADAEVYRPAPHGWRHVLGLGVHSTTFFSRAGSQYTFHSASLGYHGSLGARGVFLDASLLMPLQARQDGHVYSTGEYYSRRSGGDLLLGWHWRWSPARGVEADAGPGLHGTLIYLPGKPGYRDFTALPLGIGAAGAVWWGTRKERLSRTVTVGAFASAAYDFYDPAHADDLVRGFTFRAGLAVGLGARR